VLRGNRVKFLSNSALPINIKLCNSSNIYFIRAPHSVSKINNPTLKITLSSLFINFKINDRSEIDKLCNLLCRFPLDCVHIGKRHFRKPFESGYVSVSIYLTAGLSTKYQVLIKYLTFQRSTYQKPFDGTHIF
jgi:hypothetical protein